MAGRAGRGGNAERGGRREGCSVFRVPCSGGWRSSHAYVRTGAGFRGLAEFARLRANGVPGAGFRFSRSVFSAR